MEARPDTSTYSYRVTEIYKRISKDLGESKAKLFNEFVRGTSLLDNEDYEMLNKIEGLNKDDTAEFISELETKGEGFMKGYKVDTLYEAFQKIREAGRTKLFVWKDCKYQQLKISADEEKLLPWDGEIKTGGPKRSITGIVAVVKDYNFDLKSNAIIINGYTFK